MPVTMSKREHKKYLKDLSKKIYQKEFDKARVDFLRKQRKDKIEQIKKQAREDAQTGKAGIQGQISKGMQRMQRGAMRIQKKRVELAKKFQPYVNNLEAKFEMPEQFKKKKPPSLF